jgi:hypothetical protein
MVAATAAARGDSYCSLAWGTKLANLSDAATAAQVIRGEHENLFGREAALARWSRRVVDDPNATTDLQLLDNAPGPVRQAVAYGRRPGPSSSPSS